MTEKKRATCRCIEPKESLSLLIFYLYSCSNLLSHTSRTQFSMSTQVFPFRFGLIKVWNAEVRHSAVLIRTTVTQVQNANTKCQTASSLSGDSEFHFKFISVLFHCFVFCFCVCGFLPLSLFCFRPVILATDWVISKNQSWSHQADSATTD